MFMIVFINYNFKGLMGKPNRPFAIQLLFSFKFTINPYFFQKNFF